DHALQFADRALLLHQGQAQAQGSCAEILTAQNLSRLYGVSVHVTEVDTPAGGRRVCVPAPWEKWGGAAEFREGRGGARGRRTATGTGLPTGTAPETAMETAPPGRRPGGASPGARTWACRCGSSPPWSAW